MDRHGDEIDHVSTIIRSLCIKLGHFDDRGYEVDDATRTLWELGHAFEGAVRQSLCGRYAEHNPDRFCVPGTVEKEGLFGNIDLADTHDSAVIEMKLTKLSSRHDPDSDKFWKYWVQVKAYCYMMGWPLARLHVCHINGDYRGNSGPTYNVWEDRFSERELFENFRMLKTHRDWMRRQRDQLGSQQPVKGR